MLTARRTMRVLALGTALAAAIAVVGPLTAAGASVAGGGTKADEAFATLDITAATVEVKAKGEDKFEKAADGDPVKAGDTVRTDATGRVEIQYGEDAYTRLDVNTTFKITKLTDEQGNRQVQGTIESGQTWNRTAKLTESQSFEQTGADATAAVEGTAFAVICEDATHCIFTGVVDQVSLTGKDGVKKLLSPLDQCDSTAGVLCADITKISADDLPQWILDNLILDLARGYPWPFGSGTVVVDNGSIVFVPSPPASTAPTLDGNAIVCDYSCTSSVNPVSTTDVVPPGFIPAPGNAIFTTDDYYDSGVAFVPNVSSNPTGAPLYVVFTKLPDLVGYVRYVCGGECNIDVQLGDSYLVGDGEYFYFTANDVGECNDYWTCDESQDAGAQEGGPNYTDTMTFYVTTDESATDPAQASTPATIDVTVSDQVACSASTEVDAQVC